MDDTVKELVNATKDRLSRLDVKEHLQLQKNKAIEQGLPVLWKDFGQSFKTGLDRYEAGIAGTEYAEQSCLLIDNDRELRVQRKYPRPYDFEAKLNQRKIDFTVFPLNSKNIGPSDSFVVDVHDNLDLFVKRYHTPEVIGNAEDLASAALRFMLNARL